MTKCCRVTGLSVSWQQLQHMLAISGGVLCVEAVVFPTCHRLRAVGVRFPS